MMKVGKVFPFIMSMLFKKPATVSYPATKAEMPDNFRGKLQFDKEKCIGCNICVRNCPARAIEIEKVPDVEKKFKALVYLDRCIYCAQCVDSCPKKALQSTKEFELANSDRANLKVEI